MKTLHEVSLKLRDLEKACDRCALASRFCTHSASGFPDTSGFREELIIKLSRSE